jgi:hypothetical protein
MKHAQRRLANQDGHATPWSTRRTNAVSPLNWLIFQYLAIRGVRVRVGRRATAVMGR